MRKDYISIRPPTEGVLLRNETSGDDSYLCHPLWMKEGGAMMTSIDRNVLGIFSHQYAIFAN